MHYIPDSLIAHYFFLNPEKAPSMITILMKPFALKSWDVHPSGFLSKFSVFCRVTKALIDWTGRKAKPLEAGCGEHIDMTWGRGGDKRGGNHT